MAERQMPGFYDYIDLHCERVADGLFQEPLNTLSNFLFFVAAYFLFKQLKKSERHDVKLGFLKFLTFMTVIIGIGSIVFHMSARMWGSVVDVLPIAIFAIVLMYKFARIPFGLNRLESVFALFVFAMINISFKINVVKAPDGYVSLIPSAVVLCLLSLYMLHTKNSSAKVFLKATAIATIAILCRTVDTMMNDYGTCHYFPIGTHFLWHSLMAWFIFILIEELITRKVALAKQKTHLLRKIRRSDEGLRKEDFRPRRRRRRGRK